jgi:6,7-dimethyl-8-ribityllumazine synthase
MSLNVLEGHFNSGSHTFAIVAAKFNQAVVDRLVEGALDGLRRHGVADKNITLVRVPGSYEIPLVANKLALSGKFSSIICLGAVIKGETASTNGIASISLQTGLPIIFGVLTCDTLEQAINRAGAKAGNKGFEAALTAIEMADLILKLPK